MFRKANLSSIGWATDSNHTAFYLLADIEWPLGRKPIAMLASLNIMSQAVRSSIPINNLLLT